MNTTLDDAVAAHMAHAAGSGADPLTDSLSEQMNTQPAPLRAGWETEPIVVPLPWRWAAVVVLFTVLVSSALMGCGGSSEEEDTKNTGPVDCRARPELCI